jgi:hypothetical protein
MSGVCVYVLGQPQGRVVVPVKRRKSGSAGALNNSNTTTALDALFYSHTLCVSSICVEAGGTWSISTVPDSATSSYPV